MEIPAEIAVTGPTRAKLVGAPRTMCEIHKRHMAVNRIECQIEPAPMQRATVVRITDTLRISACVGENIHNVTIFGITKSGQVQSVISHPAAREMVKLIESARPHSNVAVNNSVA